MLLISTCYLPILFLYFGSDNNISIQYTVTLYQTRKTIALRWRRCAIGFQSLVFFNTSDKSNVLVRKKFPKRRTITDPYRSTTVHIQRYLLWWSQTIIPLDATMPMFFKSCINVDNAILRVNKLWIRHIQTFIVHWNALETKCTHTLMLFFDKRFIKLKNDCDRQ